MKRPGKATLAATIGGLAVAGVTATALIGGPAQAEAPAPTPSGSAAPATPATPDPGARKEERQQELAKALAAELGIDEARVAAALEKVQAERQAQARTERTAAMKERLDAAVSEGKLTQEQADAILKAAESGVLSGGGWGHRGGPGGRPGR